MAIKAIFDGGIEIKYAYGRYGWTRNNGNTWHGGVDITCPDQPATATSVYSIVAGTVTRSRIVTDTSNKTWEWGHYVTIQDSNGTQYIHAHLNSRSVSQGDTVSVGTKLGVMGKTGNASSTYEHVHFEVRVNDSAVNPCNYLGINNAVGVYGSGGINPPDPPGPPDPPDPPDPLQGRYDEAVTNRNAARGRLDAASGRLAGAEGDFPARIVAAGQAGSGVIQAAYNEAAGWADGLLPKANAYANNVEEIRRNV